MARIEIELIGYLCENSIHTTSLVQHTGYYPYGKPSGQPYLFAGKERLRDLALNDYDFTARRLSSALCLWTSPDPLAQRFADTGPYIYCSANPVKFIDPSGCVIKYNGSAEDLKKIECFWQNIIGSAGEASIIDGNLQFELKDDPIEATQTQISAAHYIKKYFIDDEVVSSLSISNSDPTIWIGNADKATIDLSDIVAFGEYVPLGSERIILHETVEQFKLKKRPGINKLIAHESAINIECRLLYEHIKGNLDVSDVYYAKDWGTGIAKYNYKKVVRKTENPLIYEEGPLQTIEIPFIRGNLVKK